MENPARNGYLCPWGRDAVSIKQFPEGGGGGGVPTTITVANEATDTTCFPLFATAATGDLGPKSNASLTFNSNTAQLGVSTINLTGGQIAFPATQAASSDANTLDDYEEGTWTPTLWDNSLSDGESQGYTTQSGYYVKIGHTVWIWFKLAMSSLGTLTTTQNARIGGLPFTSTATANSQGGGVMMSAAGLGYAAATGTVAYISASTAYINLWARDTAAGGSATTVAEVSASGNFNFIGWYEASA